MFDRMEGSDSKSRTERSQPGEQGRVRCDVKIGGPPGLDVGASAVRSIHDLNNLLDGVLRYVNLALRVLEKGQSDSARKYLMQSREGLMRMLSIMQQVLGPARAVGMEVRYLTVREAAEQAVGLLKATADQVRMEVVDRSGEACRFPGAILVQVFSNVVKNAIDAMGGRGRLAVEITAEDAWVYAAFSDTGPGFDPADAERLFEPFFTTKPDGAGTGLGLAICRDLLSRVGGQIEAENLSEGGCRVTVRLPRHGAQAGGTSSGGDTGLEGVPGEGRRSAEEDGR